MTAHAAAAPTLGADGARAARPPAHRPALAIALLFVLLAPAPFVLSDLPATVAGMVAGQKLLWAAAMVGVAFAPRGALAPGARRAADR